MNLTDLISEIGAHFCSPSSLARAEVMTGVASQVEGWWRAEVMWLMQAAKSQGRLANWDRERRNGAGRQAFDFWADLNPGEAVLELKAVFCGRQKGQLWRLPSYGTPGGGWIATDILKLATYKATHSNTICLQMVVAYPAPLQIEWDGLLKVLLTTATNIRFLGVHSSPTGEVSIGFLEVV